jgi:3-oxoacyl-[acyl-carrier-protein] synthase II
MNDGAEARSYEQFFGGALPGVKISSTKAAIGHTLGAAGAVEAAFTVLALRDGAVPPQLNTRSPLPSMAASLPAVGTRIPELRHAMSVNLGFGGSNAALLFSKDGGVA